MSIRTELRGGRGVVIGLCVVLAAAYLIIGVVHSDGWLTLGAPVLMLGYAAVLIAFRSRSEPMSLLGGTTGDERQRQVMMRATALTGNVLILATMVGFFWALAVGNDTVSNVLAALGAIGGITFGAAVCWFSRHA